MVNLAKKIVVAILTLEARLVLAKYKPHIVGVTGSVGKTSTKDAVFAVLAHKVQARKSDKSFNSEFGVPLTVLGLPTAWNSVVGWLTNILDGMLPLLFRSTYPSWLVLEIGADRPGDIRHTCSYVKPDIAILTRFPEVPVHVEYFGSREAVIEEKRELRRALKPDGTLIVNADDVEVATEPIAEGQHRLAYGFSEGADVRAHGYEVLYDEHARPIGSRVAVTFQGEQVTLPLLGVLGMHHVYPALAALAVGLSEGMLLAELAPVLGELERSPGRMRTIPGVRNTTIIDDTYNSSPVAVHAALETVKALRVRGRKLAVLGDMMELGEFSVREHRAVGEMAAQSVDLLVVVGVRMREAGTGARERGMVEGSVLYAQHATEAAEKLGELVHEGDLVLVKGSQSMRMERVVEALMAEPERKKELLVRQDPEWAVRT